VSLAKVEEIFSPQGSLSRVLAPGFEWRPQQAEMAVSVYRTLKSGGRLLVEAPTGVGKSLAYLVPGILWAFEARRPLVVSTYTRNLQDQILDNDLPRVRRLIDREIRAVVLKGRANYLCRARWEQYLEEMRGTVEGGDLERVLGGWARATETGDLSEVQIPPGRAGAIVQAALPRIASEGRFCAANRCTAESGCFFRRSRDQARDAALIVVNHSLLLIDLFSGLAGLPEWTSVVIDEGHHLPPLAVEQLSFSVSEDGLDSVLKGLGGRGEPGLTEQLRRLLRGHASKVERTQMLSRLRELEEVTARLSLLGRAFWRELQGSPHFPRADQRLRFGPSAPVLDLFPASGLEFVNQLAPHLDELGEAIERMRAMRREAPEVELLASAEAERLLEDARGTLHALQDLLTPDRSGYVYWIEPAAAGGITLKAAPGEVGPQLREALVIRRETTILTSATLALEGSFDHLAGKLGLRSDDYEGLVLPTPFRLSEQVAAFVVTGAPDPNQPAAVSFLAQGITRLAHGLRRKMLVLFTAHESLRRAESALRVPLEERGVRLLAQGVDGGRRQIHQGFRSQGPAVLLGAASFWEGVDFPGEELEILVMARLPFLVPTDPMVQAISERLASEGCDPFRTYHLPEAMVRFRQGFGRLIRRTGDRGLFVVVDPRLETKGYGAQFKQSIGVPFRAVSSWEELVAEGERWFDAD
jgi:Rad3-related DNA helicase